jgi:lysophospholipase L1-like esterase
VHTGDNGIIERGQLETALHALADATRVIVAVPYVPREWQADNRATIEAVAARYPNVTLMPWDVTAKEHPEYLWNDGIHLTPTGEQVYADMVTAAAVKP